MVRERTETKRRKSMKERQKHLSKAHQQKVKRVQWIERNTQKTQRTDGVKQRQEILTVFV